MISRHGIVGPAITSTLLSCFSRPPLPAGDRHSPRAIAPMSEWHRLAWPPGPRVAPPHVATWHAGVLAGTAYASDLGCRRPLQAAES
ncbi:hypothetical protein B296_00045418 [Ensete ventricosum]|uniref:Uncharacterized protein n=1 Tax=Ensete ventricosum TaxID=4639 RepID=A0A426YLB9_ENSVE|nr:hypothetical protein B296_00045418 [Ensete ventricosum]